MFVNRSSTRCDDGSLQKPVLLELSAAIKAFGESGMRFESSLINILR